MTIAHEAQVLLEKAYWEVQHLKDKLAQEKRYLEAEIRSEHGFEEIVGQSQAIRRVLRQVEKVASTATTVLIQGEKGTGKELIASRLGVDGVRDEPRLRERDVGSWSGLTRAEIEERWPGYLAARRSPPDFEGDAQLLARTRAGLLAAVDGRRTGDLLVVTHGGVVRTIERSLGATPDKLPNLAGRWILADAPTELALGERVVLVEPEDVTVPREQSEQDPVGREAS